MDKVREWLEEIDMSNYSDKFEGHGLDRLSIVANDMTPIDLFEIGINRPHSNYIMRHAKSGAITHTNNHRSYNHKQINNEHDEQKDSTLLEAAAVHESSDAPSKTHTTKGNVIWQENTTNLKQEFDRELITTFDEIIAMFGCVEQGIKSSLNDDILSNTKQISNMMNATNSQIKEYQFHREKCQKLYSLILHKKVQLQTIKMNRHELRAVKKEGIKWINELKESLIATTTHAQNVKQNMNRIMATFNGHNDNQMFGENVCDSARDTHQDDIVKNAEKLNSFAMELQQIDEMDSIYSDDTNANSTVDYDKYAKPRNEWQLYYTNFCRKYPLLAKTKKGKKKAKLYFQCLDDAGKKHYSEWKNWEKIRTQRRKQGKIVSPNYFHRRSLTVHDFLWKGFM
eukprot:236793_1